MRPAPQLIDEFVRQPLSEIDVGEVFAFGAPWSRIADALRLPEHHTTITLNVPSRGLGCSDSRARNG
jgi:hypothetical protein